MDDDVEEEEKNFDPTMMMNTILLLSSMMIPARIDNIESIVVPAQSLTSNNNVVMTMMLSLQRLKPPKAKIMKQILILVETLMYL